MKNKKVKVNEGTVNVVAEPSKFAKMKACLKRNRKRIVAGGLTIVVIAGSIVAFRSCSKDKDNENNNSIVDIQKDEEYSRELLNERIKSFTEEAKQRGIDITENEVRDFAAFMNIDRIINEDPELASELFDGKNAQDILSNAGHMIGVLITNSFKENYKNPINLSTLVVGNDYDKRIMQKLENYRDELTTMRAEEVGEHRVEFATDEETAKFNDIITDIIDFYSMSANGLEINGENVVVQKMGDGDRFALVLVMNEIALGNRNLLTNEQYESFEQLMTNETVVANLHRIIEGCQTEELESSNQLTK